MKRPRAPISAVAAAQLRRRVGGGRQEGLEPGVRAIVDATRELWEAVYGGRDGMRSAGYEPPDVENIGCACCACRRPPLQQALVDLQDQDGCCSAVD